MLHAASMLTGLWIIWLLANGGWRTPEDLIVSLAAALVCVAFAARAGGAGDGFTRAPHALLLSFSRLSAVFRGALSTMRAAIAADVTLKPALVRVKTRTQHASDRAAFGGMISATPGMTVVDVDGDGVLVHVLNEDAVDAEDLGRLEAQVLGGRGGGR